MRYQITEEQREEAVRAQREYYLHHECGEIRDEINYDQETMRDALNVALHGQGPSRTGKFTDSQKELYEAVKDAVEGKSGKHIM